MAKACPICGKPPAAPFTPFCSKRCQQADLGRWFAGSYSIPVRDDAEEEAAPEDSSEEQ